MKTPIRVQRKRTKGFKLPENTVCVTRGTKWGNPFVLRKLEEPKYEIYCAVVRNANNFEFAKTIALEKAGVYFISEKECIDAILGMYELYLSLITFSTQIKQSLKGKNLACFCPLDKPCHADILLQIAN